MAVALSRMKADKRLESREKILQAARLEFAAKGFAGARMESIARKARINKAMLHYYYGSKRNLYMKVLHSLFGADRTIPFDVDQFDLSPGQKLHAIIFLMVHLHLDVYDDTFHQILSWEMAEGRKHLKTLAKDYLVPRLEKIESIVKEGVKSGDFETQNPLLAVWGLVSLFMGYSMQRDTYADTPLYKRMYAKVSNDDMLRFALDHTFKAIAPAGKVDVPSLPEPVRSGIVDYLKTISTT